MLTIDSHIDSHRANGSCINRIAFVDLFRILFKLTKAEGRNIFISNKGPFWSCLMSHILYKLLLIFLSIDCESTLDPSTVTCRWLVSHTLICLYIYIYIYIYQEESDILLKRSQCGLFTFSRITAEIPRSSFNFRHLWLHFEISQMTEAPTPSLTTTNIYILLKLGLGNIYLCFVRVFSFLL